MLSMETLYLLCFVVGLVLCVLSFAGGMGRLHMGHVSLGHWHVGHAHPGRAHAGHGAASFLNGFTVTAFLCWFGGIGFLLTRHHHLPFSLVLLYAFAAGMVGATLIFLFLAKVLLPHERALTPEDTEMRGVLARVSGLMQRGRVGEIVFTLNGTRRASAARSLHGELIGKDEAVCVVDYTGGMATVRRCTERESIVAQSPNR